MEIHYGPFYVPELAGKKYFTNSDIVWLKHNYQPEYSNTSINNGENNGSTEKEASRSSEGFKE